MDHDPPFQDLHVKARFEALPEPARTGLLRLRRLIFQVARELPEVGRLEETLKWGQPAYLTPDTKSGSTIRLGLPKTGGFAIYTHCQTSLISDFRGIFRDHFEYEGNRAVHFRDADAIQPEKVRMLISRALTYHLKTSVD